jgi:hypothetical protein
MADVTPYQRKLHSVFKTGKHAGETLADVIDNDIEHIKKLWKSGFIAFDGIAWDYFLEKAGDKKSENKVQTNIYKRYYKK